MTRRLVFGIFLAAAVALPASFPNPFKRSKNAASAPKDSEKAAENKLAFESVYTHGTIAAIPRLTSGKLDLSDKTALRFQYGKPTWSLDYTKIVSIEVGDKKAPARMLVIPKVTKDKRVFHLTFNGDRGQKHNIFLEMPVDTAIEVLPLLEERSGKSAVVEGMVNPDGWWGDRYWRTARNQEVWDEANGVNKSTVAQSKDE
jgi:hypothetical protein